MNDEEVDAVIQDDAPEVKVQPDEWHLDEALLSLLRRGFEAREAGSLKGWH